MKMLSVQTEHQAQLDFERRLLVALATPEFRARLLDGPVAAVAERVVVPEPDVDVDAAPGWIPLFVDIDCRTVMGSDAESGDVYAVGELTPVEAAALEAELGAVDDGPGRAQRLAELRQGWAQYWARVEQARREA